MELINTKRYVSLVGEGGIGKTRIAREIGICELNAYVDGVWFVDLSGSSDPHSVLECVAREIGLDSASATLDSLRAFCRAKTFLLILDNCENVVEAAAVLVDSMLRTCRGVKILSTSRERLQIAGEWAYRVPPLSLPDSLATTRDDVLKSEAGRLFYERARAISSRFELTDRTAAIVAQICHHLDGIPLAIELAASRVESFTAEEILFMLARRFDVLVTPNRTSIERHQRMRASFDWSFDLLSVAEQTIFVRASCFAGGWAVESAQAVCAFGQLADANVQELLASLVNKSMLVMDPLRVRTRYRFLESAHAYALQKLVESNELQQVRGKLAYSTAAFAIKMRRAYYTIPRIDWIKPMIEELENARLSLEWATAVGDSGVAIAIIAGYNSFWFEVGYFSEGLGWISRFAGDPSLSSENRALLDAARCSLTTGNACIEAALASIDYFEHSGDPQNLVACYIRLSTGYRQVSKFEEANLAITRALEASRAAGLEQTLLYAAALSWQASALIGLARQAEARSAFTAAIALNERFDDWERAAIERLNLAELEFSVGNVLQALVETEASLEELRDKHNSGTIVASLNAAAYRIILGRYVEAYLAALEAVGKLNTVIFPLWKAVGIQHLATLVALAGQPSRAAILLGYVDASYAVAESTREPTEVRTLEILVHKLAALDSADRKSFAQVGASMSDEEAMQLASAERELVLEKLSKISGA